MIGMVMGENDLFHLVPTPAHLLPGLFPQGPVLLAIQPGIDQGVPAGSPYDVRLDDLERKRQGQGYFGQVFPDRKSTRLNSSHVKISYAVFCLKKKNSRNT